MMTALPPLTDWNTTRDSLQSASQVIGLIRKMFVPPQPNALHLPLFVVPSGLSTGPLEIDGDVHEVTLDLVNQVLRFSFGGIGSQTLTAASLTTLAQRAAGLAEQEPPDLPDLRGFDIDPVLAQNYAHALSRIYSAVARFRARLYGMMTPIVVWPHHFDLSFLYFIGSGSDDHSDPHMNFGFAPYSATIDRPYLYFYAWPLPEGIINTPLPEPAYWFSEDWTGVVVDYDKLIQESDPESVIESVLFSIFSLVRPAMDGA